MLLAVAALVVGARSVLFLLKRRISTAKVIRVLGSPMLIEFLLLLAATFGPATGLLPLFEPRMGMKPTTTERTPLPQKHTLLLQGRSGGEAESRTWGRRRENKKKGKAIETDFKTRRSKSQAGRINKN
jgi:hypothetical protein